MYGQDLINGGARVCFRMVFFSYKINVILINKLQQQQPSCGPNPLESDMDPQKTSRGRPNVFFSIFFFFFFLICKKDIYI